MKCIFNTISFAVIILLVIPAFSQKKHDGKIQYFYITRHSEKDLGENPGLSIQGLHRSGDLYRFLRNMHIDEIYVTKYRRTQMTADSLRIHQNLKTIIYEADTTGHDLLYKMNERNGFMKNLLIIGHSNTIPAIIRRLGITDFKLKEIPDNEYDILYIIRQKKQKDFSHNQKIWPPLIVG